MMAVSKVHKDQFVVLNHSRNKKGYMSAVDGRIIGKKAGSYIYGVVVGTRNKSSNNKFIKRNKNLQLTDNLNIFNTFLTSDKLTKGMQLQGTVESKEGKGYIIDLLLKDQGKAFLNFKDYKGKELQEGELITVIMKGSISKSQKIIKCAHISAIENIEDWAIDIHSEINFECVKPGFLVECKIQSIVENGLNVSFGKGVNGVIFIDHLAQDLSKYKKKGKILARVISVDFEKKRIGLSELENIVKLQNTAPPARQGEVLTNVKVLKKVYGHSYIVQGESTETGDILKCFLHQNHIAAAVKIQENKKKRTKDAFEKKKEFEVDEKLHCNVRIKEFNYFDNIPIVSSMEGINENVVLNWDTVKGGITVEGTIRETVDDNYFVVDLNDQIFGRVYKTHISDAPQKKINKKLRSTKGKITMKTWKVISDSEILELTMKESIVKNKVFTPLNLDDPMIKNGVKMTGVLKARDEKGYIIEYFNNLRGFLPFDNLEKYGEKISFKKGTLIEAYLLFKTKEGLSLTVSKEESIKFKPKPGQDAAGRSKIYIPKNANFEKGDKAQGIICKFNKSCSYPLTIKLSEKHLGVVFFSDLGLKEGFDQSELERMFEIGSVIDVYIKTPKEGEGKIECSLIPPEQERSVKRFEEGSKALCRYVKFKNGFGATVQLSPTKYGFIDICELTDEIEKFDKTLFFARVIDVSQTKIQLSARDSLVDDEKYKILGTDGTSLEYKKAFGESQKKGDLRNLIIKYHNWRELLTENTLVRGYVTSINQHGVFIKLARNLSVRANLREISDDPNVKPEDFLSRNTLVLGRILNFYKDKVNITLRESIVTYGIDEVDISEFQAGFKAKLMVLSIANKLAFCQIIGSRYKCKVKLTKEDPTVKIGQKIIARIKSVNEDNPPKIMMHEVEECNEVMTEEYDRLISLMSEVKEVQQDFLQHKDDDEEEKVSEVNINQNEVEQNIEDLQELLEVGEESSDKEMDEEAKKITKFLKFDEGEKEQEEEKEAKEEDKKKETKTMNQHIQEEISIMLKERGIKEEDHDSHYYERMLLANPSNSFLWIHYISQELAKKGYKDAKVLCERAVKSIDITKLKEKLNLWIAYMNLESKFGKEKEFKSIINRALKINDQKEIYLAVIDIYKRRKNYKIIEGFYIILTKKYNFHLDVWKKYVEYLFEAHNIKEDDKHPDHILLVDVELTEKIDVLSKALKILERKQQIELMRKYATEEYKYGNIEKGRTMHESIIHSYPNRTDIVSTYLDLEIKHSKNKGNIRKVFDKLLARENIKLKQIKFLFKRYLEFETEYGSEKDVERVRNKAQEFASKFGNDEGESDSEAEGEDEGESEDEQGPAEEQQKDKEMSNESEDSDESD
ncbi:unnamed protein product [Moneuplotes crassus]|uniref:S1 motif domain-containing protein n=1 Tax=Euplotes crassus TaxID=5936 RepID=A0AAD1U593_EUPCR|nr:unnamed protein product [Moneuplotes crassus]